MDFLEDLFDRNDHRRGRSHNEHNERGDRYRDGHGRGDSRYHDDDRHSLESLRPIIAKVLRNKPLLIGLAAGAGLLALIAVGLLFMLLPVIGQALGYVDKNGVKGIVDMFLPIVDKLWKGQ